MENDNKNPSNGEQLLVTEEKDSEVTIDLGRIFRALLKNIWIIAIATVLFGVISFGYTKLFIPNEYKSTAQIYVQNETSTNAVNSSDAYVATAFTYVIKSYETLNRVIEKNSLDITYGQFAKMLTIAEEDVGVINIVITSTEREQASQLANALLEILQERADEVFKNDVYVGVINAARTPTAKSGPSELTNTALGAVIGFVLACGVFVVIEVLNNNIYEDDYLISTYNIPVLTDVPDFRVEKKGSAYYYHGSKHRVNRV